MLAAGMPFFVCWRFDFPALDVGLSTAGEGGARLSTSLMLKIV